MKPPRCSTENLARRIAQFVFGSNVLNSTQKQNYNGNSKCICEYLRSFTHEARAQEVLVHAKAETMDVTAIGFRSTAKITMHTRQRSSPKQSGIKLPFVSSF